MKELSLEGARAMQRKAHYQRYQGPKLKGSRTRLQRGAEGFPDALMNIPEPPNELFVVGNPLALEEGLAVVGARNATPYGLECARFFSKRAAEKGIIIISGGAYGCDTAAHEAAVEAGCPTVVFLGGGCDEIYPAVNHSLFQRIIEVGGAIVSEHTWTYPPLMHTFRARNRLIAGLAQATLIVEAGLPSGTFSTADEALAANREVWVIPGSIASSTSRGTNRLLYQGATPIIDEDVFDDLTFALFGALKQEYVNTQVPHSSKADNLLLAALRAQPMRMDEMLEFVKNKYEGNPQEVLTMHLSELQRQGEVARYPDGRYGMAKL